MADTWNKRAREKKKQQARKEKAEKRQERKENSNAGKSLVDMLAYIDENGNLSSTPPDVVPAPLKKIISRPEPATLAANR